MRQPPAENLTRIELVVPPNEARLRLDQFLAKRLPEFSRSRLQQLIRDRFVRLNNSTTRPRHIVRGGDKIELTEPPPEKVETLPEAIPLEILYKDTSGCLFVSKNDGTHRDLSKQFAARTVEKIYLALVAGKLPKTAGVIEEKIGRHPVHRKRMSATTLGGRAAKTEYRVVQASDRASLVECRLYSGRTHQIRVHLHHLGHAVLGDKVYAPRLAKDFPRQMLHAWKLGFRHPRTEEWKSFEAPLPNDFATAIKLTIESQQV